MCSSDLLFEYLMAGKPVLVSDTVEQKAVVERFRVGRVCRDLSAESIREAVLALVHDPPDSYAQALEMACDEFCWERQERRLAEIYGALALERRWTVARQ